MAVALMAAMGTAGRGEAAEGPAITGRIEDEDLVVRCGDRSIRLRPVLDVKEDVIDAALKIMDRECRRL